MKKYIIAALTIGITSMASAQIDRSKMPEPGPAPSVNLKTPYEFSLDNGLHVMVVENHKLPRVRANLMIDNTPMYFGQKEGVEDMLSSLFGTGTEKRSKDEFNKRIDFLGANVFFGGSSAYMSSLSKYFEEVLGLMAEGVLMPKFTQEEFDSEMTRSLDGLKAEENSADAASERVRRMIDYGKNHPYSESVTKETLQNVTLADVQGYYSNYFVPNNAYLVIVGDVNKMETQKLVTQLFSGWKNNSNLRFAKLPLPPAVEQTTVELVNLPAATQSIINVSYPIQLTKNDPDYFAVQVASNILGGNFNSRLNMNLREAHGWTYGARGGVRDDKYIGRFYARAKVRNEVTDSAVVETMKVIKGMTTGMVTAEELANTKAMFTGDFVRSVEKPETVADFALNTKTQNLPADFYKNYIKNINAVTIADVERVSKKYFKPENANIHITGKGEEIAPGIKKLGYPVNFYDKWGAKTQDPSVMEAVPADMTAEKVVNLYLEAIGGRKNAEAVKSISTDFTLTGAAPVPLQGQMAYMAPNKELFVISMQGQVAQKSTFDGTTLKVTGMMGNSEKTGDDVADKAAKKGIIEQAFYTPDQIKLVGMGSVNGNKAYKVEVTQNGSTQTEYYDAKSYWLVQVDSTEKTPQGEVPVTFNFSDYQKFGNLGYPTKMVQTVGPQVMNFEFSNIKVNEEVTADMFTQ